MLDDAAIVLSGIGLLFAGMDFLTSGLRKLSGRRFRTTLTSWTRNGWQALLWGGAAGALTQSMTTVLFMLIGLVRIGAIAPEVAFALIPGANLGSSMLALATAFNLDLVMLAVLGISGLLMSRNTSSAAQPASVVFGVGILFLGLHQMKAGAEPLLALDSVRAMIAHSDGSILLALTFGTVLRLAVHSSVAIVILAATLAAANVLTLAQAVAVVVGVVLGSAGSVWMLSQRQPGRGRQIAAFAVLTNLVGAAMLLVLLAIKANGQPLAIMLVSWATPGIRLQVALTLVLAYLPGLALVPLRRPLARLLRRVLPESETENDSVCRYIRDDSLADPEGAIELAWMEQRDIIHFPSRILDRVRRGLSPRALQAAFEARQQRLAEFIDELGTAMLSKHDYERVAALIASQRLVESIGSTVCDLAAEIALCGPKLTSVTNLVLESSDTVLMTLEATLAEPDEYDMRLLRAMTGNRSSALQAIRESYLERQASLDNQARLQLLTLTNLCERFFWLVSSFLNSPSLSLPNSSKEIVIKT